MFDHRVKNRQQFTHASDQGEFGRFACGAQPFVESCDDRVTSTGNQGGHVECCTNSGPATPDYATASEGTAVTVERSDPGQCCNLFTVELPEFGELGQQGTANHRTDCGDASEQVLVFLPDWASTNALIEVLVGTPKFGLQPADVSSDTLCDGLRYCTEAVFFGDDHLSELPSTDNQCSQLEQGLIGQGAHSRTHSFGEAGQDHSIDSVSFGQLTSGFGKVSNLTGVNHHHGKFSTDQSTRQLMLDSTCSFEHDQSRVDFCQSCDQRLNTRFVIRNRFPFPRRSYSDVEGCF